MQTNTIAITKETFRVWAALSFVIIVVQTRDTIICIISCLKTAHPLYDLHVHWNQDQDKACNNA